MAKVFAAPCLAILGVALALASCSPAPLIERLPTELGGMPSAAPAPSQRPYRYPAVHDTPPPRATAPLTDEQQLELEKGLQSAREKQQSEAAALKDAPDDKAAADGAKAAK